MTPNSRARTKHRAAIAPALGNTPSSGAHDVKYLVIRISTPADALPCFQLGLRDLKTSAILSCEVRPSPGKPNRQQPVFLNQDDGR
eukprot:3229815-Pyramimonas_sp.AAC.1